MLYSLVRMNTLQKLVLGILPDDWAKTIEAGSKKWRMVCGRGHAVSVWDAGGLRAEAAGKPRRFARRPKCRKLKMMKLEKRA